MMEWIRNTIKYTSQHPQSCTDLGLPTGIDITEEKILKDICMDMALLRLLRIEGNIEAIFHMAYPSIKDCSNRYRISLQFHSHLLNGLDTENVKPLFHDTRCCFAEEQARVLLWGAFDAAIAEEGVEFFCQ